MPPYHSPFRPGDLVRVVSREKLSEFLPENWLGETEDGDTYSLHHPIEESWLEYAGREFTVRSVGYYHCGDILLELDGIEGRWHESSVEDSLVDNENWYGYPRPSECFDIGSEERNGHGYVVVKDLDGVECLAARSYSLEGAALDAGYMREVAAVLHYVSVTDRYQFSGTCEMPKPQFFSDEEFDAADTPAVRKEVNDLLLGMIHDGTAEIDVSNILSKDAIHRLKVIADLTKTGPPFVNSVTLDIEGGSIEFTVSARPVGDSETIIVRQRAVE